MTNYERNDYELNSVISEELNNIMKRHDKFFNLNHIRDNLNKVIELSEREILCDEEVTELEESLYFISNNLKNEDSLRKMNKIVNELIQVYGDIRYNNEFNDNVVNI